MCIVCVNLRRELLEKKMKVKSVRRGMKEGEMRKDGMIAIYSFMKCID